MLPSTIREAARRFGDLPALIDAAGRPFSYRDIDRRSDALAVGMSAAGVGEGSVVALTLPSVPEYPIAYLAAAKLGATTAGVNPRMTERERAVLVDMVQPSLVVESADQVDDLEEPGSDPPPLADDPDRPVTIVFTSGTTGTPKGAVFGNRQLRAIAEVDVGLDTWGGGGPMLSSTEFAHIGFATKVAWYLRLGTTQVLMERWRPDDALRLAEEHRMTSLGGVPPQFALMLRHPRFGDFDLSAVARVTLGAGPATPRLRQEIIERFDALLSVRFSSTESGGAGTGTEFGAPDEEGLYSEGRPRGPIRLSIRDDGGRAVGVGETGEVCLHTPTAMIGYWQDSAATREVFWDDGYLRTGDHGWADDQGCLHLSGRSTDMYVRGGYNVFPLEVEAVLSRHPAVAEVAVVPRPDDVMGEVGVAVVVARPGKSAPTIEELRSYAAPHLAAYKLPEDLRVVDVLPLTPMNKVDRRALLAEVGRRPVAVLDGESAPPSPVVSQDPGRRDGEG